jgi:Protein of unknown function DUF262
MYTDVTTPLRLLEGSVQIIVPDYQRPYTWEDHQLEGFWSGLAAAVGESGKGSATFFLGSMLLTQKPSPVGTPHQWTVVDGRQRIISVAVLICAIRDYLTAEDAVQYGDHGDITNRLLVNRFEAREFRYKLEVTAGDRPALLGCIEGTPAPEPGHRIAKARDFFRARLTEADNAARIFEALLHRTELVRVVADHETLSSLYSLEPAVSA